LEERVVAFSLRVLEFAVIFERKRLTLVFIVAKSADCLELMIVQISVISFSRRFAAFKLLIRDLIRLSFIVGVNVAPPASLAVVF
jgi:hypothetical protein